MIKLKTLKKHAVISDNRASCKYVVEFTVNTGSTTEKLFDNLPKFILDRVSEKFPEIVDYKKGNITLSLSRSYLVSDLSKAEMKQFIESTITKEAYQKAKRILGKIKRELDDYSDSIAKSIKNYERIIDAEDEFIEKLTE